MSEPQPDYFRLSVDDLKRVTSSKFILKTMIEVPAGEAWVYEDPKLINSLTRGLSQEGIHDMGSFSEFADDHL